SLALSQASQQFLGMGAGNRNFAGPCRRSTESWRRRRVDNSARFDEGATRHVVRVRSGFFEVEHRRKTHISPFQQLAPFFSGPAGKTGLELRTQGRPLGTLPLLFECFVLYIAELQQLFVKRRFNGTDGNVLAVRAGITAVEMGAAIQHIGLALIQPATAGQRTVIGGGKNRRSIGNGGIYHLTLAATTRLKQRAYNSERQHHAATADISYQMQGRCGWTISMPHGVQRPSD